MKNASYFAKKKLKTTSCNFGISTAASWPTDEPGAYINILPEVKYNSAIRQKAGLASIRTRKGFCKFCMIDIWIFIASAI